MPLRGSIFVRAAHGRDHEAMVGVWRRAVRATHGFLGEGDVDRIEAEVRLALSRLGPRPHVAVDGPRVVGFIAAEDQSVEMLFVDPPLHGRGVGTLLLADAVDLERPVRVDVNEQNPSGRAFYAARGFRQTGRSPQDSVGRPFALLHLLRDPERPDLRDS